jgi:hypothetical protein
VKPFEGAAGSAIYAAPILLFVFPPLTTVERAAAPWLLFERSHAPPGMARAGDPKREALLISALFALAAEASWSAYHPDGATRQRCCSTPSSASSIWGYRSRGDWGKSLTPCGSGAVVLASPSCCSSRRRAARRRRAGGMASCSRSTVGVVHRKRRWSPSGAVDRAGSAVMAQLGVW